MNIDKDMLDAMYNKYMKKMMSCDKKIHDEKCDKNTEEDILCGNILDEISSRDINEDELYKMFSEYSKKKITNRMEEDDFNLDEPKIFLNCKLKVDFDTKNKMIYLYPGKSQFFTADVSKCYGNVTIKYKGCYTDAGIQGNLARYRIVQSGIIADAYSKLNPRKKDVLHFTAIDECTKECFDFVVVFCSGLCTCCQ